MKLLSLYLTMVLAVVIPAAMAADEAQTVTVSEAYIRLAPPNAPAAGAFMVLRNPGYTQAKLLGATNPASRLTEMHTHLHEDGMMKMRAVREIVVPAGSEVVLKPGGLHLMLIDLVAPLKEGESIPLSLNFGDGSTRLIKVPVRRQASATKP